LQNANDELRAKIESYKKALKGLLDDNPTAENLERIRELGLLPVSTAQDGLYKGLSPIPAASLTATNPISCPYDDSNSSNSVPIHDGNDPPSEWNGSGYDPNDGRIAGRQAGWHPILVVRQSEDISSSMEPYDDELPLPYHKPAVICALP
jgi:hypothetical protein